MDSDPQTGSNMSSENHYPTEDYEEVLDRDYDQEEAEYNWNDGKSIDDRPCGEQTPTMKPETGASAAPYVIQGGLLLMPPNTGIVGVTGPCSPQVAPQTGCTGSVGPTKTDFVSPAMRQYVSVEDEKALKDYAILSNGGLPPFGYTEGPDNYHPNLPWIQTHSGRRFTPTKPQRDSIVIQDIAHALSMQCRFSGHVNRFYSVAQHSISVSYLCDEEDALWGLLHDASEAYLVDVPTPIKKSGYMEDYIKFEKEVQKAVCHRFFLQEKEPPSVKKADMLMLVTEARDLMSPLRDDWKVDLEPLPFTIDPWDQQKAKDQFMKRFIELTKEFDHYMKK